MLALGEGQASTLSLKRSGDVRIMTAVDAPELRHHRHVLVFSTQGPRWGHTRSLACHGI